ncbi:MAG: phosphate acyltransferase, partial [Bacteroidia bacterium]|nr:phosphate acyltransferase [Bacteroidia bacterium]
AVAKAAMESGVAQFDINDWDGYKTELRKRLGLDNRFLRNLTLRAKQNSQRVVFAEADNPKILKAAHTAKEEGSCIPILLGFEDYIRGQIEELGLNLDDCTIIDPSRSPEVTNRYGQIYYEKRARKGITLLEATRKMRQRTYFGTMMVELGEADAFISGQNRNYPDTIRPALEIIGKEDGTNKVAGMYIIMSKQGPLFFADTTVNIDPSSEDLVDIVRLIHKTVTKLQIKPRIAMLSYSNFGSAKGKTVTNIQKALQKLNTENPEILVDGEMQANTALDAELRQELFPFCKFGSENANVFIFPALSSGNIAYKMVQSLGISEAIGPVLVGFRKSVHVLQLGSSVREIVNMINLAVVDAQSKKGLF